jgi:hypothetical protein
MKLEFDGLHIAVTGITPRSAAGLMHMCSRKNHMNIRILSHDA